MNKCSTDTANRDIQDLVQKGILHVDVPGVKRPSYSICYSRDDSSIEHLFTDVAIVEEDAAYFLTATFRGSPIRIDVLLPHCNQAYYEIRRRALTRNLRFFPPLIFLRRSNVPTNVPTAFFMLGGVGNLL